jgi:hypothetical protein
VGREGRERGSRLEGRVALTGEVDMEGWASEQGGTDGKGNSKVESIASDARGGWGQTRRSSGTEGKRKGGSGLNQRTSDHGETGEGGASGGRVRK